MLPRQQLSRLRRSAWGRLGRLYVVLQPIAPSRWREFDAVVAFGVLEAQNLWAEFGRASYLSCILDPYLESGARVTRSNASILDFDDAIDEIIRKVKPHLYRPARKGSWTRREEPAWHEARSLLSGTQLLGVSHQPQVDGSLSTGSAVLRDLPTFRNFYAHRNKDTFASALGVATSRYSIHSPMHPTRALCTPAYGRPRPLLLDWLDDIRITVELLCA